MRLAAANAPASLAWLLPARVPPVAAAAAIYSVICSNICSNGMRETAQARDVTATSHTAEALPPHPLQ
eukprot:14143827-Alexandrium_andersonii.AAC.1